MEIIDVDFSEPFVHDNPLEGLRIYGAFDTHKKVLKDYRDRDGYRRVRFQFSDGEVREVRLLKSKIYMGHRSSSQD